MTIDLTEQETAPLLRKLDDIIPISTGNENDALLALVDGKWVVLRVPYPLSFLPRAWTAALTILMRDGRAVACGRLAAPELHRHKGDLLQRQGHAETAEELYRKALSIAQEQDAKLWELRATTSLARLLRDHGCRGEPRDLLAPVYSWFSEGFDTADLKKAEALNELA
jgi:tetratricopeptide (TPR) repeat protein